MRMIIGNFVICGGDKADSTRYVFAMQLHEEEEFVIPSAANNQQVELTFRLKLSFNLDQSRQMQSEMAPRVLQFLNVMIKQVIRAKDFKQIGKLPKYF